MQWLTINLALKVACRRGLNEEIWYPLPLSWAGNLAILCGQSQMYLCESQHVASSPAGQCQSAAWHPQWQSFSS